MSQMLAEAQEAPEKIKNLLLEDKDLYFRLGKRLRDLNPAMVATIARGSSDHAASYAAYLLPSLVGRVVASIPPSLVTVLDVRLRLANQFVLAVSQSGASPDLNAALASARKCGALTAALVNDETSALAKGAEVFLPQRAGVESGLAATKTVLCSFAAIARLAGEWAEDQRLLRSLAELPPILDAACAAGLRFDESSLSGISDVFVLSRAYGLSAAQEVALKLKETCRVHSESFSAAEVRHGPREIVKPGFLILALALPGSAEKDVVAAALELQAQGGRAILVGPAEVASPNLPFFELPPVNDERLAPLVALQALYPWLARASVALGLNPDRPKHLHSKLVKTY